MVTNDDLFVRGTLFYIKYIFHIISNSREIIYAISLPKDDFIGVDMSKELSEMTLK